MFPLMTTGTDSTLEPAYFSELFSGTFSGTSAQTMAYIEAIVGETIPDEAKNDSTIFEEWLNQKGWTLKTLAELIIPSQKEEVTYEGEAPLTIESDGDPASAYLFKGKLNQLTTPTPTSPVYATEVGTLVESGEHIGKYAVPITTGDGTQTIYLDEPLRKIGDYSDTFSSTGTITRRIGKIVLDGTESFTNTTSIVCFTPKNAEHNMIMLETGECVCSHYIYSNKSSSQSPNNSITTTGGNGKGIFFKTDYAGDKTSFAAYAAAQHTNHTPITVWFILAEETTEVFEYPPTLQLKKGENIISFEGLSPSYCSITCTKTTSGPSISADKISYDNTDTHLVSENVQDALNEINEKQRLDHQRLYSSCCLQTTSQSLSTDSKIEIGYTNCKKNGVFSFAGKITSFDTLLLGQGFETFSGAWLEINDTKVIVHNYSQTDSTVEYTHGLTISDYIYVQVFVTIGKATIIIFSNEETFKQENVTWNGCNGSYFVKSIESSLTDCKFMWTCPDLKKSVWVFGDSYVGLNNPARWATVLRNAGFADNIYINGYAGESSTRAIDALEDITENMAARPATLIWCLGMNDGEDSGEIPSTNWSNGIERVIEICKTYDINLVMATIPSVPNHSNEAKNAYIRDSGYRYIDFAKAVGAQPDGTWYTNMLDIDNVHPTEKGATALYHRAIIDCPELTFTNP